MSANACTLTDLCQGIKAVLFDLDGTLYLGNQLVDGIADVLNGLADHDLKPLYVTNNSSKSRTIYRKIHDALAPVEKLIHETFGEL